ncbi:MAG: hypothetical protein LBE35_07280 [Clostridiales bacterium]|jgi:hypothetical protein|nr:hypothetical protein [Clostridiales bacterium]
MILEKIVERLNEIAAAEKYPDYYIILDNLTRDNQEYDTVTGDIVFMSKNKDEAMENMFKIKRRTALVEGVNTPGMKMMRLGGLRV